MTVVRCLLGAAVCMLPMSRSDRLKNFSRLLFLSLRSQCLAWSLLALSLAVSKKPSVLVFRLLPTCGPGSCDAGGTLAMPARSSRMHVMTTSWSSLLQWRLQSTQSTALRESCLFCLTTRSMLDMCILHMRCTAHWNDLWRISSCRTSSARMTQSSDMLLATDVLVLIPSSLMPRIAFSPKMSPCFRSHRSLPCALSVTQPKRTM
mmetsp:Transcript_43235/g.108263  ORF Transcript_43235/g.108263 Transcript_43235/m.108263 type:complete len:205 (+) Transcript_43235:1423-2037(+)